tara:strand:- start:812 stop:2299 length:1488 start_codon:yes stop_codon:yes gene_type:complete
MNILKVENFNKYLKKIFLVLILLTLTLVPWIDFVNANLDELDFIFNNNFIILLAIYFFVIFFIYLIFVFFSPLTGYSLVSFISIFIWLLFQHNFLKSNINLFFNIINISTKYSSEVALVFILILTYLFFIFIKKKTIISNFFIIFLSLNFFFSALQFTTEFYSKKKVIELFEQDKKVQSDNTKKPNIYFFVLDAMMPLNEFENYYKINLSNFKNFYDEKKYKYYKNTLNLYPDTVATLTSLFFLEEEIYIDYKKEKKNEYKPGIYKTFPGLLKKQYNPILISELKDLGYEFKWIGNNFADCSRYNYRYCLSNKKEEYIDWYIVQSFLKKTPLIQIFNKLTETEIIQKNLQINHRGDAIGKLKKFLILSQNYQKENSIFYFIHHMHPHWPYRHDKNCDYKKFPGKTNFEGYKNSYLCVIKKITNIINFIEETDENALVIFQSDHNWQMSILSEKKYGKRNKIFNLVKNNIKCEKNLTEGLNNVQITNYLIGCLKEK